MFITAKRLLHRYRDRRLYVTEVNFLRSDEPYRIFVYVAELNRELELQTNTILRRKRLRSQQQTIYQMHIHRNLSAILVLDDRRGNHYLYCSEITYKSLLGLIRKPYIGVLDPTSSELTQALAETAAAYTPYRPQASSRKQRRITRKRLHPTPQPAIYSQQPSSQRPDTAQSSSNSGTYRTTINLPPRSVRHSKQPITNIGQTLKSFVYHML